MHNFVRSEDKSGGEVIQDCHAYITEALHFLSDDYYETVTPNPISLHMEELKNTLEAAEDSQIIIKKGNT